LQGVALCEDFSTAKNVSHRALAWLNIPGFSGGIRRPTMKAKIIITPKKAVVDPQGKTVQRALQHVGYTGIGTVHVGKYLEVELIGSDKEAARQQLDAACHKFLSNPIIEDYRLEIE
jgi:phosphoribosylformylglycinamidine synthase PurS subunit